MGVSLRDALARIRVARGKKPAAEVVYQPPGKPVQVGVTVAGGKPTATVTYRPPGSPIGIGITWSGGKPTLGITWGK